MPLFSVIIPVYNAEQYLVECVQSVLGQDFKRLEIILVDDCSTDKSGKLCDSFAKQNKNIKTIHQRKNCGVSVSRNVGINAASGKYIIFLDSDDYLSDGCLNGIAKLIDEKPETDVIIGKFICNPEINKEFCYDYLFDRNDISKSETDDVIAHINLSGFMGVCWCYIINHKFIKENNLHFIPVRIFEDTEFTVRLLCLCRKFVFYDELFYCHRRRAGSLGQSINRNYGASGLLAVSGMCKFIKDHYLSNAKKEFVYSRIKNVLNVFVLCMFVHNREEIYELSIIIEKNIDSFKVLENISEDFDLYFFIETFGAYHGLVLYKTFITEKTISLIKNIRGREFYIFCAGIFGEGVARILRNEGYSVKGFLDNNKALQGSIIFDLNVSSPAILSNKSKDELSDIFVIICNQSRDNVKEITSQLKEIGLGEEQISFSNILEML